MTSKDTKLTDTTTPDASSSPSPSSKPRLSDTEALFRCGMELNITTFSLNNVLRFVADETNTPFLHDLASSLVTPRCAMNRLRPDKFYKAILLRICKLPLSDILKLAAFVCHNRAELNSLQPEGRGAGMAADWKANGNRLWAVACKIEAGETPTIGAPLQSVNDRMERERKKDVKRKKQEAKAKAGAPQTSETSTKNTSVKATPPAKPQAARVVKPRTEAA